MTTEQKVRNEFMENIKEEIESFIETMEVVSNKKLLKDIDYALKNLDEKHLTSLEDLKKEIQ